MNAGHLHLEEVGVPRFVTHGSPTTKVLFNHFVRASKQRKRHAETERLRCPKIDAHHILSGLLDWNVRRTRTPNDFIDQSSALTA